jgi:hypothetical protein
MHILLQKLHGQLTPQQQACAELQTSALALAPLQQPVAMADELHKQYGNMQNQIHVSRVNTYKFMSI